MAASTASCCSCAAPLPGDRRARRGHTPPARLRRGAPAWSSSRRRRAAWPLRCDHAARPAAAASGRPSTTTPSSSSSSARWPSRWHTSAVSTTSSSSPSCGMADPWRYRNKMEFSFGRDERRLVLGLHRRGSWRDIVDLPDCRLARRDLAGAAGGPDACRALSLQPYSQASHTGLLRHLVVRAAQASGDLLLNLFVTERFPRGARAGPARRAEQPFTSFAVTVNARRADAAVGDGPFMIAGPPYLHEELAGLPLRVPAIAFLQTNCEMCGVLYETALRAARPQAGRRAYDLYCGIGCIAPPARREAALESTAWSCSPRPSQRPPRTPGSTASPTSTSWPATCARCCSTRRPAATPTARARARPTASRTSRCARRRRSAFEPPAVRASPTRRAPAWPRRPSSALAQLGAERIVYVSCNPTTLAANGAQLAELRLPPRRGHAGGHVPADPPHRGGGDLRQRGVGQADAASAGRTLRRGTAVVARRRAPRQRCRSALAARKASASSGSAGSAATTAPIAMVTTNEAVMATSVSRRRKPEPTAAARYRPKNSRSLVPSPE